MSANRGFYLFPLPSFESERPYSHYIPHLAPLIQEEIFKANKYTTLETVFLRVSQHITECLGISRGEWILENRLYVNPDNALAIDQLWTEYVTADVQMTQEDYTAYEKFKANDYLRPVDIMRMIKSLLLRHVSTRELNNNEKVLSDNKLCIIFAMDGFSGFAPTDVKNYMENLSVGKVCVKNREKHAKGVRDMYEAFEVNTKVTGTDANLLVFLALLELYKEHTADSHMKVIAEEKINSIKDDLVKYAQAYPDLKTLSKPEFVEHLISIYKASEVNIQKMAAIKLSQLFNKGKRTAAKKNAEKKQRKRHADAMSA